ncbi:50S ribosomal protein L25 [Candidatus Contubernalis alkaliaceticus]|uniref:50S ribosomal protein L25 n=1 Tax=Candidatus Contubernalis alkaliaceticus TaxID=338645 RepID=UPI001F4BD304|nr:50S ribosomal protein L25 [Candidatus Contubernalis alkalaceticus]UNC90699.1 50S ribosomal protein L25 [Candidatus Contubernalis alkalaceticus]
MERLELIAQAREVSSKGQIKDMRKMDVVPAVVYGKKVDNTLVSVGRKELYQALNTSAGANILIDLLIEGDKKRKETVMVKEIQKHPIKDIFLHVDFIGISLEDKIQVKVPISFIGEPVGVKEGGVPSIQLREVIVETLPTDIPEYLEVDISQLDIGASLNVSDLMIPEGAEVMGDPEETIISVLAPTAEEEPMEEEEILEEGAEESAEEEGESEE